MIKNVWVVYFSPSGKTEQVALTAAHALAEKLHIEHVQSYDFTLPEKRIQTLSFSEEDFVVFACPTYAGRIPNKILPFVRDQLKGNHTPAAIFMTYGGRSIDHSLMEAYLTLRENGFNIYGAGTVVTRHVMSDVLSAGRPGTRDFQAIVQFCNALIQKMTKHPEIYNVVQLPGSDPVGPYYKPLEADGSPANFLKAKPKVNDSMMCNHCGLCAAVCPMGSISKENIEEVPGVCIKCHACIRKCPTGARYFDDASLASHIKMLEEHFANQTKENNWYL